MTIIFDDNPDESTLRQIEAGLGRHNDDALGVRMERWALALQDESRRCVGGITGGIIGDVFMIRWLWVDKPLRGQGWGRQLMARCEEKAAQESCRRIWVDTGTFQAPDFYKKLGYKPHTVIPDFYAGHDRIFFCKDIR